MDTQLRRLILLLALCLIPTLYFFFNASWRLPVPLKPSHGLVPANATLGFGAVLAVSHATSPRRKDLIFAANLTGIELTIPDQPKWTAEDLDAFRSPEKSRIKKGSALAWMGHLNALTWFLSTDLETALILEDDVDWDIHLRSTQVPLAAAAMRQLLSTPSSPNTTIPLPSTYWGPLTWELLYLGHCGDFFPSTQLPPSHLPYADLSTPPLARLHTKTAAFLRQLGITSHMRIAHRSRWPLCTFGYGVTRASAARILAEFSTEGEGGCQAFDVRVLEACRDKQWACYTINPELFHHISAPSEIANVDQGKEAGGDGAKGIDEQGRLKKQSLKGTTNIACGARQRAFYTEDGSTLEWLKGVVGGKGVCLVDMMEEDMSRWP